MPTVEDALLTSEWSTIIVWDTVLGSIIFVRKRGRVPGVFCDTTAFFGKV